MKPAAISSCLLHSKLEQRGRVYERRSALQLIVEGHTDNQGTIQSKFKGGQGCSGGGVPTAKRHYENRLEVVGCGQSKPVDGNNTAKEWANNRRVELRLHF